MNVLVNFGQNIYNVNFTNNLPVLVVGLSILHKIWLFGTQQISSKESHANDALGQWECVNLICKSSWWLSFSRIKGIHQ